MLYLCLRDSYPHPGEPFTAEEFDEMMTAALDPDKKVVFYSEHAELMALEDDPY